MPGSLDENAVRRMLTEIRGRCEDGKAEERKFAHPLSRAAAAYLVGYLLQTLESIKREVEMLG